MSIRIDSVHGWEIHRREDGGFGVYDGLELIAGPFRTKQAAYNAALFLPPHRSLRSLVGSLQRSA